MSADGTCVKELDEIITIGRAGIVSASEELADDDLADGQSAGQHEAEQGRQDGQAPGHGGQFISEAREFNTVALN